MQSAAEATTTDATVAGGRYRIETRIARGGMGAVYRAFDHTLARPVALKRLRSDAHDRRTARMFEREFHTLAGLSHPRIIQVFDYGVDAHGPYYTMELLDGRDLRDVSPLPYREACVHLRDLASSLALLHARNLLHRDLSPRNVRITAEGRAKLIDFGALAAFGRHTTVVGTPPLVPPEALRGGVLDQRADLFSLGALAYWVLTGKHAFDVRKIRELRVAWKRDPRPPSELVAENAPERDPIPHELDALVLSLLSRNPLARPSSAAEVSSRLTAIAELPPDAEPLSALSYLRGSKTVGRGRQRARLRRSLKQAVGGHGAVYVIEAARGMGTSRILGDLAIEAQLRGATAVVIDAEQHRGSHGVTRELVRALYEQHPEHVRESMAPHAAELARFLRGEDASITATRNALSRDEAVGDPRERRMRSQEALHAWLAEMTRQQPLLIAVRNAQRADDASVSLLAALSRGTGRRRLMIALAYDPREPASAPAALSAVREQARVLKLAGLSRDDLRLLVSGTFGQVPNVERLTEWLQELTGGAPQACMDLIRHLVESGVIRYAGGVWILPQELSPRELPADLGQALGARIGRLGTSARTLAEAISVQRGPLSHERVVELAEDLQLSGPLGVIDELERAEVLVREGERHRFAHGRLRQALLDSLGDARRTRLHAQLGALLERRAGDDLNARLDAGWHLLHGGERQRGAEILAEIGTLLAYDGDEISAAIPALEAALDVYREHDRPPQEIAELLCTLAMAGYYSERRVLEDYGPEGVDLMEEVLGLRLAARLRPLLGRRLSVLVGLGSAWMRLARARGVGAAGPELARLVVLFLTSGTALVGLGTITLDGPWARNYAERLQPLVALGGDAERAYRAARGLSLIPEDRVAQALSILRPVLRELEGASPSRSMPRGAIELQHTALLYAVGSLEAFRDSPEALEIADRLDAKRQRLARLYADQVRANYYTQRGELQRAEHYRQQVELYAVQAGSGWQAEAWAGSGRLLGYRSTGDVTGLKRVSGTLDRLARQMPSLERQARLAEAAYYMERGDHQKATELGGPIWREVEPRGYIGWAATVGGQVRNACVLRSPAEAAETGRWALSLYDAADRQVCAMFTPLLVEVAMAEAHAGDLLRAATRLEDYLKELGERGGPTTRGALHEARARVALLGSDLHGAREHLAQMERHVLPTENPALVARAERLRRAIDQAGGDDLRDTQQFPVPVRRASGDE
jgi:hypothetical protein